MPWWDRDDEDDKPHTTSLRMWRTSDRKPKGGNARMWSTSDCNGGTLRMWTTAKPKPTPTAEEYETYRQAAEAAENVRTGNWTAPWKDAPLPGTPEEARARQKRTRFRYHEQRDTSLKWTDTKARSAARKGGARRSRRKTEANRAKGRYGILGARYGKLGGRPRKPRP